MTSSGFLQIFFFFKFLNFLLLKQHGAHHTRIFFFFSPYVPVCIRQDVHYARLIRQLKNFMLKLFLNVEKKWDLQAIFILKLEKKLNRFSTDFFFKFPKFSVAKIARCIFTREIILVAVLVSPYHRQDVHYARLKRQLKIRILKLFLNVFKKLGLVKIFLF